MPARLVVTAAPKVSATVPPRPARHLATAPHVSADLGGGSGDPSWYQAALAEYQAHQTVFGNADGNRRIHEYFMATSFHPSVGAHEAWCSAFVNWCMRAVGIVGTNSAAAASWRSWGIELAEPQHGCVMVIHWSHHTGGSGNHVTFFDKAAGSRIYYFGGNQGHMIKESSSHPNSFASVHYRWPSNG